MKPCPICQGSSKLLDFQVFDDRYGYPGKFKVYECNGCGHIFLGLEEPLNLEKLYTEYYPRRSYTIEDYRPPSIHSNPLKVWFNGEKRAYSLVPKNVRVLDVGCGFGESLGYHKARGCEVYGLEADANVQKVSDHFDLNIKVGQLEPGLFPDNFFDVITMDQVLEHTLDPLETMKLVYRFLKPGGKFICTIPNARGLGRKLFKENWIHWHAPYHLHFFSIKSLAIAAEKSHMKLQEAYTHTSSEWLFYQKMHNIYGAQPGKPSVFWDPMRTKERATDDQDQRAVDVRFWHRRRINHFLTRILDFLGLGDNLFVVFEKA